MIITYPPISYPCYAGIDFPSQETFSLRHASNDLQVPEAANNISKIIGADYVAYNGPTNLAKAIGIPEEESVLPAQQEIILLLG